MLSRKWRERVAPVTAPPQRMVGRGLSFEFVHTFHGHGEMRLTVHLESQLAQYVGTRIRWALQNPLRQDEKKSGYFPYFVSTI